MHWFLSSVSQRRGACNDKEGARTAIEVDRGYAGSRHRRELDYKHVHRFPFCCGFSCFSFFRECL